MTNLDLTDTIAPKSDQANADDFVSGPRTFTITEVRMTGSEDQPFAVYLAEFDAARPYKPAKSMRRVMVAAWGKDGSAYVGRRLTLYTDPEVRFGGSAVGGIRIQAMSHIDKPMKLSLTVTKGRRAPFTVQPLADSAPPTARGEAGITPAQLTALNAALANDMGLTDRDDKLAYLSGELGRDIGSSKEITKDEASRLLDRIKSWAEPASEEPPTLPEPPLDEGGAQ